MKPTFSDFLVQLRKEKNLTQKQLAEIFGVSDKTVSHWERGDSSPDITLLPVIASLFEITVDELLSGERKTDKTSSEQFNDDELLNNETIAENFLKHKMNELKIQNILCATISVSALLLGLITDTIFYMGMSFVCIFVMIISLTMNLIFRNKFELTLKKFAIENETLTSYRYKANRFFALNCYLSVIIVFFIVMYEYAEECIFILSLPIIIAGIVTWKLYFILRSAIK